MAKSHSIAQAKYDSTHCKYYSFKFHLVNDADVIDRLEQQKSKQGYIKDLIRQDIARTHSVPTSPVPDLPVPKKQMTVKQILSFLKTQTGSFDGSMYELLNALTNEYMNN